MVLFLTPAGQSHRSSPNHQIRVSHRVSRLLHHSADSGGAQHHPQNVRVRGDIRDTQSRGVAVAALAQRQFGVRALQRRRWLWSGYS
ncbi:hypothetical protein ANCCAN_19098 [Ancylostoma caninum]|uniref:Uncharacterized protein n=1 Tax=Ancylostoma caninum TaxID=29170 RepID=A0A368FXP7_ANCCA|nr:hypothetical protein ANCCAN_19098 [Ancylostoma caninum]